MPVSATELCPDCDYDLHGLPLMHACPECGFEFDPTMTVFRPARPKVLWIPVILGAALAIGGGGLWPLIFEYHGDVHSLSDGQWLCFVLGTLWLFICLRPLLPLGGWRYAIVHQDGLLARRGARKYAAAWEDVRSAWLFPTMTVWVRARIDGRGRLLRIRGVFDEWEDARRFAKQVRTRVRMALTGCRRK